MFPHFPAAMGSIVSKKKSANTSYEDKSVPAPTIADMPESEQQRWGRRPSRLSTPAPEGKKELKKSPRPTPDAGIANIILMEINPDRVEEFLRVMQTHIEESRKSLGKGSLRFDLLRDPENSNKFLYYECFVDQKAVDTYYQAKPIPEHLKDEKPADTNKPIWEQYKENGIIGQVTVYKLNTTSIPGRWGFESGPIVPAVEANSSVVSIVEIKPDKVNDFLKAMETDVKQSRDKAVDPGCLRFDLLRDSTDTQRFIMYEVYEDNAAVEAHQTSDHHKLWTDFRDNGAVASEEILKLSATAIDGGWAFQSCLIPGRRLSR